MKTIAENIKYPDFKEEYKNGQWITGHLVKVGDLYYNHSKRVITAYEYSELPSYMTDSIERYNKEQQDLEEKAEEIKRNIAAHYALIEWAKENASSMTRSNQSESEYYFVHHTDGRTYQIRVSGHRYPTGSMTDLMLGKIDSTDTCCAKYCEMLGIEF